MTDLETRIDNFLAWLDRNLARAEKYLRRYRKHGRHQLKNRTPVVPDRLADHIDILTMPVHTCEPPPVPAPAAYLQLGPQRVMAARESMRRREAALSHYGTPETADECEVDRELVSA